jgi:cytochrome c biogenesis protein CcdA
VIGDNVANTLLGTDAKAVNLAGGTALFGLAFSFVAGLAGTFTACNCVVFSCIAPLAGAKDRAARIGRSIGQMALGVVAVTGLYGIAGAVLGDSIPTLSQGKLAIGKGYPVYLAQSTLVFTVLGLFLVWWGLQVAGLLPDVLEQAAAARPWLKPFLLGALVGCFTIGRPFPLFRKAFGLVAQTHNPLFGAGALALHGLGNILVISVVMLGLVYLTGGRFARWVQANPHRMAVISAVSLIIGGAFFVAYWGLRVPSYFGVGWFPHMPYQ